MPPLTGRAPQGVDNVYTQHQPLLYDTIDNINKGYAPQRQSACGMRSLLVPSNSARGSNRRKVKDADYPYAGPALSAKERPQVREKRAKDAAAVSVSTAKLTPCPHRTSSSLWWAVRRTRRHARSRC